MLVSDKDHTLPCLIYAAGGGWGHLSRSLALARVAANKYHVRVISNSVHAKQIVSSAEWARLSCPSEDSFGSSASSNHPEPDKICLDGNNRKHPIEIIDLAFSEPEQFKKDVRQIFSEQDYAFLSIDTFPRGLLGELPDLLASNRSGHRVLVHRDINADYTKRFGIEKFVSENFDLVINPGERDNPPLSSMAEYTEPWMICDSNELPDRTQLRLKLGVSSEQETLVLICASGKKEELSFYINLSQEIANHFPALIVRCLVPEGRKLRRTAYLSIIGQE